MRFIQFLVKFAFLTALTTAFLTAWEVPNFRSWLAANVPLDVFWVKLAAMMLFAVVSLWFLSTSSPKKKEKEEKSTTSVMLEEMLAAMQRLEGKVGRQVVVPQPVTMPVPPKPIELLTEAVAYAQRLDIVNDVTMDKLKRLHEVVTALGDVDWPDFGSLPDADELERLTIVSTAVSKLEGLDATMLGDMKTKVEGLGGVIDAVVGITNSIEDIDRLKTDVEGLQGVATAASALLNSTDLDFEAAQKRIDALDGMISAVEDAAIDGDRNERSFEGLKGLVEGMVEVVTASKVLLAGTPDFGDYKLKFEALDETLSALDDACYDDDGEERSFEDLKTTVEGIKELMGSAKALFGSGVSFTEAKAQFDDIDLMLGAIEDAVKDRDADELAGAVDNMGKAVKAALRLKRATEG